MSHHLPVIAIILVLAFSNRFIKTRSILPFIATILVFAFHKSVVNDVFMKRHGACATPFIVHLGITLLSKNRSLVCTSAVFCVVYSNIFYSFTDNESFPLVPSFRTMHLIHV